MLSKSTHGAIVLAAGSSSRLGCPKQLVQFEGESLLRRAASAALASGASPVIVILGELAARLRSELDGLPVTAVHNRNWAEGMASSLRCGVRQLQQAAPEVSAVMLLVSDQPLLRPVHLQALWQQQVITGQVVAAEYNGHPGVPAIFPARYFPRLLALQGDQGARALLRKMSPLELVTFPLPEAATDLDTPTDVLRFICP